MAELKEHNSKKSFYILIGGKVYDATKFLDEHPGGDEVLLHEAGQDATDAFEDVGHSDEARALLPAMLVGTVESANKGSSGGASGGKASGAVEAGSNMMYFIPLAALGAYFAYRSFA